MTREEKIRIALVLLAISAVAVGTAYFAGNGAGLAPLGHRIGGPEVI